LAQENLADKQHKAEVLRDDIAHIESLTEERGQLAGFAEAANTVEQVRSNFETGSYKDRADELAAAVAALEAETAGTDGWNTKNEAKELA
jgi:hypothetical protein